MIQVNPGDPRGIVWLASYPKSGNTWLRVFLYHMMRIAGGHPREENEINKLDRASTYEARLYGLFEQAMGKPLAEASEADVARVRPQIHATIRDRINTISMVKTHNVFGHLGNVPIINLQASCGTIYIVRDPRDVAPSLASHLGTSIDEAISVMGTSGYKTNNKKEAAYEIWGSWSEHVYSWTVQPHEAILVLRYEDMLEKPTETFTAVVKHLRQAPNDAVIQEAIELSSFDKLKKQELEYDFRERSERADRFFVSGTSGGWKEKLTDEQAQRIAEKHADQMRRFGYV